MWQAQLWNLWISYKQQVWTIDCTYTCYKIWMLKIQIYHTIMFKGWASTVLTRVWDLQKKNTNVFRHERWRFDVPTTVRREVETDLAFLVDILEHLNNLYVIFQGKDLFTNQTAFVLKTIKETKFEHSSTLHRTHMNSSAADTRTYSKILSNLHWEFCRWFKDFKKLQNEIQLLTCSFSSDFDKAPDTLHIELINLQSAEGLKRSSILWSVPIYFTVVRFQAYFE
jgi:hypothetical protein